jgi:hypothetical protein
VQCCSWTFFAKSFGMVADRFGVGWMIIRRLEIMWARKTKAWTGSLRRLNASREHGCSARIGEHRKIISSE